MIEAAIAYGVSKKAQDQTTLFKSVEDELKKKTFSVEDFKKVVSFEQLVEVSQEGPYKGKSLLWLLANAAADGHQGPFTALYMKYKSEIKLLHLQVKAQSGEHVNTSALWLLLSTGHSKRSSSLCSIVVQQFEEEITLADLRNSPRNGPDEDMTGFWLLANNIFHTHCEVSRRLFAKFLPKLTMSDLRKCPKSGSHKDVSIPWLLTGDEEELSSLFSALWERHAKDFTFDDFNISRKRREDKTTTVLSHLIYYRDRMPVIPNILTHVPGTIRYLNYEKLINLLPNYSNIIHARYLFSCAIADDIYSQEDMTKLLQREKEAFSAGYLSAAFDTGIFFMSKGLHEEAKAAFARVPANSWQFENAQRFLHVTATSSHAELMVEAAPLEVVRPLVFSDQSGGQSPQSGLLLGQNTAHAGRPPKP